MKKFLPIFILSDEKRAPFSPAFAKLITQNALYLVRNDGNEKIEKQIFALPRRIKSKIILTTNLNLAHKNQLLGIHIPNHRIKITAHIISRQVFVSASAHNQREVLCAKMAGINNIFLSPIFKSQSHHGKKPLGKVKFAFIAKRFPKLNFIALGGVNEKNIFAIPQIGAKAIGGIGLAKNGKN